MNDVERQMHELVEELNQHSYRYYVEDNPVISDYEYDMLYRKLETLEEQYPELRLPYSPTSRVGDTPASAFSENLRISSSKYPSCTCFFSLS